MSQLVRTIAQTLLNPTKKKIRKYHLSRRMIKFTPEKNVVVFVSKHCRRLSNKFTPRSIFTVNVYIYGAVYM